jgi:hypothetical protein
VTPDSEGVEDPFVGASEREMGSTPLRDAQQVLEMLAAMASILVLPQGIWASPQEGSYQGWPATICPVRACGMR